MARVASSPMLAHPVALGGPCVWRAERGCRGRLVCRALWKRTDSGRLRVLVIVCGGCGQAHGPAPGVDPALRTGLPEHGPAPA